MNLTASTFVVCSVLHLMLGVDSVSAAAPSPAPRIAQAAEETDVALRVTVRIKRSATFSTPDVTHLVAARLHEVISGSAIYRSQVGRDITIHALDPDALRANQRYVFFVTGWSFGESIGVSEVDHLSEKGANTSSARISSEIAHARTAKADRELAVQLRKAQAVVLGTITSIRLEQGKSLSEHDPAWSTAGIEIVEVLSGTPRGNAFLFPATPDVAWRDVPKPKKDETAIFVLSAELPEKPKTDLLGIATPGAILPASQIDHVRKLLGKTGDRQ